MMVLTFLNLLLHDMTLIEGVAGAGNGEGQFRQPTAQDWRLTGRWATRRTAVQDAEWHKRPSRIDPFDFSSGGGPNNRPHPLAYGRVLAAYQDLLRDDAPVQETVEYLVTERYLQRQGTEGQGTCSVDAEEQSCSSSFDQSTGSAKEVDGTQGVLDTWEVVGARLLRVQIVADNTECQQLLMEVAAANVGSDGQRAQFWALPETGSIMYLLLRERGTGSLHRIAVCRDRSGSRSVMQHTHNSVALGDGNDEMEPRLKIVTYNLWNTNPPSYLYPEHEGRWQRYIKRMWHLAAVITESRADVVGLQEVKYDGFFGPEGYHAQIQHLLDLLQEHNGGEVWYKHYVYQPGMTFYDQGPGHMDPNRLFVRDEEGVAILSRYPIARTDYILLPRDFNDAMDGHQRVCLHAEIIIPGLRGQHVDIYSTHLSLSPSAREASVVAVTDFMKAGAGVAQVLLGDLNAEPNEESYKYLVGAADLKGHSGRGDLQDVFLLFHDEPERDSQDEFQRRESLTFPSCNPVKRIDFIMYKNRSTADTGCGDAVSTEDQDVPAAEAGSQSMTCQQGQDHGEEVCTQGSSDLEVSGMRPLECRLIGQDPTDDSPTDVSADTGMLDLASPVWASDHRGVYADFVFGSNRE